MTLRIFLYSEIVRKTVHTHLINVVKKGWNRTHINSGGSTIKIEKCFPYWMTTNTSILNDINIEKNTVVILSAANGYGKTTILRTIMFITLFGYAGLYAPCKSANLPTISNCFLKIPSSDKPSSNLSSFESEIVDIQDIISELNGDSLVCIDEFGRSTNPEEGIVIVKAIVEYINSMECYCVFSTHFLKLVKEYYTKPTSNISLMTLNRSHLFSSGYIENSGALDACKKFNLNDIIIKRAEYLMLTPNNVTDSKKQYPIESIEQIAVDVIGKKPIHIKNNTLIPPIYTATPCVYILLEDGDLWYCGETSNIIRRRNEHQNRKKFGEMMIFPVENKTKGLIFETRIQRRCLQQGIKLSSIKDSYHRI